MRIDHLSLANFKCFDARTFDLNPRFTIASYGVCRLCHAKPGKMRITEPDALTDKAGMS